MSEICIHAKPTHLCIFCWKKDQFEVCSVCRHKFTDPENMTHIQETGACFSCDHVLGDVLEQQNADAAEMEVYE